MTGRDRTTRTRARAPGVSGKPTEWRCEIEPTGPTQSGATVEVTRRTKDGRKPYADQRMPGAGLSCATCWEGKSIGIVSCVACKDGTMRDSTVLSGRKFTMLTGRLLHT